MNTHIEDLLVEHPECLITYRADRKNKKIYYRGNVISDMTMLNDTDEAKQVFQEADEYMQEIALKRYLAEKDGKNPDDVALFPRSEIKQQQAITASPHSWTEKRTIHIDRI